MKILRFNELITEEKKHIYEYGCVMGMLKIDNWKKDILSLIDKDDIYEEEDTDKYGLEEDTHVTLLYGIHADVDYKKVKAFIEKYKFDNKEITLGKISLFERETNNYDVVKFELSDKFIFEFNKAISDEFPYTSDYPKYQAHVTIGFVKKGKGKKYKQTLDKPFIANLNEIVYSYPVKDGTENKKLTIKLDEDE